MIQVVGTILQGNMTISLLHFLPSFPSMPVYRGKMEDKHTYRQIQEIITEDLFSQFS